ncbi:MAG TPA: carboxymuconolactone decarboxylase family protein [Kofleriaceae bacterium]|nr:carboxymuconolactone decarboxylase family protein [Kofleriaceae bacterium]
MLSLLVVAIAALPAWAGGAEPAPAKTPTAADQARADIKATFGYVPLMMNAVPDVALPGAWAEFKGLALNPQTALPGKIKDAIGLAVASQIPCKYCVYAHTQFMMLEGASAEEVKEAIMVAAMDRHWSAIFNGMNLDEKAFKADVDKWIDAGKKMAAGKMAPPKPMAVTDAKSAMADMQQYFGYVPDFMKRIPEASLPGAWIEFRDFELGETALPPKYKDLISIGIAGQIPCKYCVIADTEFAKADGATDQEISEAIMMGALTRHWSTVLNGAALDEKAFKADIDKLVKNLKKMMAAKK